MHHSWERGAATGISEGSTFIKPHKRKAASSGSSGGNVPRHKQLMDHSRQYPGRPLPSEYQPQIATEAKGAARRAKAKQAKGAARLKED